MAVPVWDRGPAGKPQRQGPEILGLQGPGRKLPAQAPPGAVLHQGRYVEPDASGLELGVFLTDHAGDMGFRRIGKPGRQPFYDGAEGGVLPGVAHETILGCRPDAVNQSGRHCH